MPPFPQPEGRRAMLRVWSAVLVVAIILGATVPCAPREQAASIAWLDLALLILGLSLIVVTTPARSEANAR